MAQNMGTSMDDDEDEDEGKAYSSITNAPVKPELSLPGRVQANAANSGGGQTPMDPKVAEFVSRTLAGQNSTPKEPDELTSSPEYQQFLQKEGELGKFRQAQVQASNMANLGQAFAQAAQGANAPTANNDLYKNIGQQGQNISKEMENEENRRQNVIKAIENRKSREDVVDLQNQSREDAADARLQAQQESAKARAEKQATDKQIAIYQNVSAQLDRAKSDPAVAQAEKDLYASKKANSLATLYGDPNKLSAPQVQILATEIAKIASGGVPSQHELEGLTPGTLSGALSSVTSKLINQPTPANAGAFIKQYQDYANALTKDAQGVIKDRYGRVIESHKALLTPAMIQSLTDQYLNRFDHPVPESKPMAPTFPMQVTKGGQMATISSADELKEANADGWK